MATDIDKDTLNKETDALFWAQTNYKVGQKLNPQNSADKAYEPVWMDIFRKVKRAADAGTLVTTFDHPVVAQHLADATVANKAAAVHLDAAVAAQDPVTTQENIRAATAATQISTQKAGAAAAHQPSAVSPSLVKEAGKEALKTPPPPSAPSGEHIAHGHARVHAHGRHVPQQGQSPAQEAIYKETNARFWQQTGYKPGQPLDRNNAQDREMAKIWMHIFRQVQHESAAGQRVPLPSPMPPQLPTPPWAGQPPMQRPPWAGQPPMQMPPWAGQPPMQMPQMQIPQMQMPPMQMPPMSPQMQPYPQRGSHKRGHGHHGQRPDPMGPQPTGPTPSMDASPQSIPGAPPPSDGASPSGGAPSDNLPSPAFPPPEEATSIGKYLAIGLAIVAGGGLIYYATSHKSPQGRSPKVLLATPTRMPPMKPFRDPTP